MKRGYLFVGGLGALIGVNIASSILKLPIVSDPLIGNYISEAIIVLTLGSILYDFLPSEWRLNPIIAPVLASLLGFVWEWLSFAVGWNLEAGIPILWKWLIYGVPTVFIIGVPIILLSSYIQKERKIFGVEVTGWKGLLLNFILSIILSAILLLIAFKVGIYSNLEKILARFI